MHRFSAIALVIAVAATGCGKKPEPPPVDVITGSFRINDITCNGQTPPAGVANLFTAPNSIELFVLGDIAIENRIEPGCVLSKRSVLAYETPGRRTEFKVFVTTGGVYNCVPSNCHALCGTEVEALRIEYDLIFDGQNLDLFSEDTDPLCDRILYTYPRTS